MSGDSLPPAIAGQMDWNRVEGNWKQFKGSPGKRDQLEGKIQERYGIEKDRVRREVDDWYGRQDW